MDSRDKKYPRRTFVKQCAAAGCGVALAGYAFGRGGPPAAAQSEEGQKASGGLKPKEARWYEGGGVLDSSRVTCRLCPHECNLEDGERGRCRVRTAKDGKLFTLVYGNPCSLHIDPIEKKPLNHFLPGTPILSIATAGCNLRCLYCQNWEISQSKPEDTENLELPPARLVEDAVQRKIPSIAYTYSEPIVFYEYAYDSSRLAREHRLRNVLVTAGYICRDPLLELCKVTDAANVDLKGFSNHFYKKVSAATLDPVLECLKIMRKEGVWLEITNLVVPTLNEDLGEIRRMCDWIAKELGPDVPLHFSRFHPMFKLKALPPTPTELLLKARGAGLEAGLHYVYIGNVPGREMQNTVCPGCKKAVIVRDGYLITANILKDGRCPCGREIAGVWA